MTGIFRINLRASANNGVKSPMSSVKDIAGKFKAKALPGPTPSDFLLAPSSLKDRAAIEAALDQGKLSWEFLPHVSSPLSP